MEGGLDNKKFSIVLHSIYMSLGEIFQEMFWTRGVSFVIQSFV